MAIGLRVFVLPALASIGYLIGSVAHGESAETELAERTVNRGTDCPPTDFDPLDLTCDTSAYGTVSITQLSSSPGGDENFCPPLEDCSWVLRIAVTNIHSSVTKICIRKCTDAGDGTCRNTNGSSSLTQDVTLHTACSSRGCWQILFKNSSGLTLQTCTFYLHCAFCGGKN